MLLQNLNQTQSRDIVNIYLRRHITFKDDVAQKAEKSILSLAPKLSNKIDLKYSVSSRPG
jgi:hypothetical protein